MYLDLSGLPYVFALAGIGLLLGLYEIARILFWAFHHIQIVFT